MNYLREISTRQTPQSEPLVGQVENSAGGHAWAVDEWTRLRRFLILGSEGGSYYASERKLSKENADAVLRCAAADGERAVAEIVAVSQAGRAPKNDPALFALAICAHAGDLATRKAAWTALPLVARIGTHLFHFAAYAEQFGGWGRGLRRAVARWYEQRDADALARQVVKYRQRDGWSHRDLLRLAHPRATSDHHAGLYDWLCGRDSDMLSLAKGDDPVFVPAVPRGVPARRVLPKHIFGFENAQCATTDAEIIDAIARYGLPREAIPPERLTSTAVWQALLDADMPMTAMIRNLATMTRVGLLTPTADATRQVIAKLGDGERLRDARVHPIQVLAAMLTYASGHGARSDSEWAPVPQIVDALDGAFYAAFGNVEPAGKRYMLALDVSGSMDGGTVAGVPGLTPRVAASAMALVTAATEPSYEAVAFTTGLTPLPLSARQRLDDVCHMTARLPFGGTDCALPMLYAEHHGREVDVFVVYTDSETWAGQIHPAQALRRYRERSGIDAKLIVCGMVSNGFTIADPDDAGMLDVVGFDTAAPTLMGEFARGAL
jgi:60 kDa SS-A/Ro ribonucleoprotein